MANSNWVIDVAHSSVEFSVKHMMFATVRGAFHDFSAEVAADPSDLTSANITFVVETKSVDTRNADRDAHLRSGDFFDCDNFPKMTFKSTKISKVKTDEYEITGDLTIRDATRPVTFTATFDGQGKDPWGNEKVGFTAEGSIDRSGFGLTWNAALETGGVLVSDQVKIALHLEAQKA